MPDRELLNERATHLTELDEPHAGVLGATIGWILPLPNDPDGHEIRFYSMHGHTEPDPSGPLIIDDVVRTARAREATWNADEAAASQ